MSKEQEETELSLGKQPGSDVTTETPDSAPVSASDKILAIKSALRIQEEERQQEETKLQIADKVRRYRHALDHPEEAAMAAEETAESADTAAAEAEEPEVTKTPKKKQKKQKKSKSKKKKSTKQKRSFGAAVRSLFPQKGDGVLEVIRKFVFLSSSAVFVICLCLIGDYFWENYKNAQLAEEMQVIYYSSRLDSDEEEETIPEDLAYEYYAMLPGAENLLEEVPDLVGWISIPGTRINYPIVQKGAEDGANDYYLNRNIYGEEAKAGSIFLDFRNNLDRVVDGKKQVENSTNLIVYGHNMHDYSMFGGLKHFSNDANYYSEHPIVELNSNYRKYQYKIFGMIIVDINDETETRFDYWNQLDFADERAFYDYVNEIKRRTIRLTDVDVQYGDQLLTLSTCNSTFSNGRLVVFARLVREGEDPITGTETSTKNPNIKWPNSYYRWHKNTYDPDAEFIPYG